MGTKKDVLEREDIISENSENHMDSKSHNVSVENIKTDEKTINEECSAEAAQISILESCDTEAEQKTSGSTEPSQNNDNMNEKFENDNNLSVKDDQNKVESANHNIPLPETHSENVASNIIEVSEHATRVDTVPSGSELNKTSSEENVEELKNNDVQKDSSVVETITDESGVKTETPLEESINIESQELQKEEVKPTSDSVQRQITRNVPIEEQPRKEFLLASSGKEK